MHTLLIQTKNLVKNEKHFTGLILTNLKKINDQKLYCDLGYSSLHAYIEGELGYSSAEAALRVANVKLMTVVPSFEKSLREGNINLTQGGSLFWAMKHSELSDKVDKFTQAIKLIEGKTTRESDKIIGEVFGSPKKIQEKIIVSERLKEKLNRLKKIYGEKSFEELMEILVDEKLLDLKSNTKKEIVNDIEEPSNRYIPISVKKAIVVRSEKQCEYVSQTGVRCQERRSLEFEHVIPYSRGGGHTVKNCKLFCKSHNLREGFKIMPQKMRKYI